MKLQLVTLCLTVGAALALPQYRPYQNYPQYQQQQQPYQQQYQRQQYQQTQQYAQYQQRAAAAPILQYSNDVNPDGSFQYSYQTGDGIAAQASGYTRNLGARDADAESQVVQGSYSYTGPDGVVYTVNYVADENGYRAQGAHLPTPPALPAAVAVRQQPLPHYQQQAVVQQPFQQRRF